MSERDTETEEKAHFGNYREEQRAEENPFKLDLFAVKWAHIKSCMRSERDNPTHGRPSRQKTVERQSRGRQRGGGGDGEGAEGRGGEVKGGLGRKTWPRIRRVKARTGRRLNRTLVS